MYGCCECWMNGWMTNEYHDYYVDMLLISMLIWHGYRNDVMSMSMDDRVSGSGWLVFWKCPTRGSAWPPEEVHPKISLLIFLIRNLNIMRFQKSWLRHQMETFSASLALCEVNPPVTGGFTSQRPVTRSYDVFFDLRLNRRFSKPSRCRWFEKPSR